MIRAVPQEMFVVRRKHLEALPQMHAFYILTTPKLFVHWGEKTALWLQLWDSTFLRPGQTERCAHGYYIEAGGGSLW